MKQTGTGGRVTLTVALIGLLLVGPAVAEEDEPIVAIDLPTMGPQARFGNWLEGALRDEPVRVRWPKFDERGELEDAPACVVTWSDPDRTGRETKRLRGHVRDGGGVVYVVGEGERHIRSARSLLGPLDVTIDELDGGAGSPEWVEHPLTGGFEEPGAVTAGAAISGVGGSPLIRVGGSQIASAFDWGPLGRAVIIDQSVLFDQLHEASPRPAVRDFVLRAALWAARAGEWSAPAEPTEGPDIPSVEELIGQQSVSPVAYETAVVDLPDDDRDRWPAVRALLADELERAELEVEEPRQREGEPLLDADALERAGIAVIGSGREGTEIHWSEPLAVGWFFNGGGRILAIPHASGGTMKRMVGFNKLLTQLRVAVSLERDDGRARIVPHPITDGIELPEEGLRVGDGAHIWAPLTESLVTVNDAPAAAAWQLGEGRIVIIDGELLLPHGDEERPYREMVSLLRNSIEWLMGEM